MYKPKYAENTDIDSVRKFVRHNSFSTIVSKSHGRLVASHVPLELSEDNSKLMGHVSRANPQWKDFDSGSEVLVIFTGPHAYISSSWYDHENVPTWNYIAVHVYGKIRIIEGDELITSLKRMTDRYEAASLHPVSLEAMSPDFVRQSLKGLVGFEISISTMEASYKLSQNRDLKNQRTIIQELENRGDPASREVALEMKKNISKPEAH
jgi:transcriptional regulator